ncbi:MAG: LamG domain-containing protein [Dictyoglomaceae bacterium]
MLKKLILFSFIFSLVVSIGFSQISSFDPNKDLIAYFPFEGNLKDVTGKFPEGKPTGVRIPISAPSIEFTDGVIGKAVLLPGQRGVLLPDDLIKDYDYSISFWVYFEKFTMHTTSFFGVYIDSQNAFRWISFVPFGWPQGTLLWARDDVKNIWYDGLFSENLQTEKWYHVVIVVDKGKAKVYVNGKQMITKVQINGQPTEEGLVPDIFSLKPGGTFAIGVNYWDPALRGKFDELRIYDRALSESEVLALYNLR